MTSATKTKPPLLTGESRAYPVLPLRDIVVFPHMIVPLFVGREKSIKALEEVMRSDTFILLATQKNASDDDPATDSIYNIGTLASVLQLLKLPDGTVKVLVEGAARAQVKQYTDREEYYEADAVVIADTSGDPVEAEAMARSVINEFEGYVKLNKKVSPEVVGVVQQIDDYAKLADTVASHLAVKIPDKQLILETPSVTERLEKVLGLMESEISVLQVEKRIRTRVKRQMEKTQREYYLNEQMKAIQKELGDEDGKDELAEIEEKIKRTTSSRSCGRCRRCRRKPPSCATISTGCSRFHGTRNPRSRRISRSPSRSSTPIISASRRSRSASSSISRCNSAPTS
jgi:ATP-dependent Lon protease